MNIITQWIHIDVAPTVEEYAKKKASTLSKFLDDTSKFEICLSKESRHQKAEDAFIAEFKVFSMGEYVQGTGKAQDIYSAIDIAHDEIFVELSSKKDKKLTLWKKGGQKIKNLLKKGFSKRG